MNGLFEVKPCIMALFHIFVSTYNTQEALILFPILFIQEKKKQLAHIVGV